LGQNDSHEAGHVSLNHKVTNLPLQVEMGHHDCVLTCRGTMKQKKNEMRERMRIENSNGKISKRRNKGTKRGRDRV